MKQYYTVKVIKTDGTVSIDLCAAATPEAAAEVVRALLACNDDSIGLVQVTICHGLPR